MTLHIVEDIKDRGQERPGIVLETGGVMSGNRRLAALLASYAEQQNERFRYFDAFIVPSTGNMTDAESSAFGDGSAASASEVNTRI